MVCCLLFSPAVSDQNPPDKHPLDHNPPCLLLFVGRLGSEHRLVGRIASEIRVSVSFQQNTRRVLSYSSRKRGYDQGGSVRGEGNLLSSLAYNVEPVTNTSSSSCANNGRRTPRCARRLPLSVAALFFTLRDSYG